MTSPITDDMLIAYLDGELDEAAMTAIDDAMADDPQLVDRLEAHAKLGRRVRDAFAPVSDEPVPSRFLALIEAADGAGEAGPRVVDLASRRKPAAVASAGWRGWGAMAACLIGGVLIGVILPRQAGGPIGPDMAARGPLASALNSQLASTQGEAMVKIGVTFKDGDGRYCRTFSGAGDNSLSGLACREGPAWKVKLAVAGGPASTSDFRTAGSETPLPVLNMVDSLMIGEALDAEAEAAAKQNGWK